MDYDDASRLTSVTYPSGEGSVTDLFYYNALGQRMEARLSGITWSYLYHGDRVLQEYALGSMKRRSNYTGGSYYDLWLDSWRSGYGYRFPLYDGTGTARGLVDVNQTVTDSYALDAFGTPTGAAQSTPNPYRYGGAWGYMTDPSGLQQLGARFYWPELGRFVQQDPIGDGMNWYAYVDNQPLTHVDPEGEGLLPVAYCYLLGRLQAKAAWNIAEASGLPGRYGGPKDAYRHCVWMCLVTKKGTYLCAQVVGTGHEWQNSRQKPPQPREHFVMDLSNNKVGIKVGRSKESCEDGCRDALDNEELFVLPKSEWRE